MVKFFKYSAAGNDFVIINEHVLGSFALTKENVVRIWALKKAVEANFTVQSTEHNAGMGLYNIKSVCTDKDTLWIISNGAALGITSINERAIDLGFDFRGCLLTYSVSLSHFEDEETLEDFNW